MLGWLTDSLDAATTPALQAVTSLAVAGDAVSAALLLAATGLVFLALASRAKSGRRRLGSQDRHPANAITAYAARLPAQARHLDFELANAQSVLAVLTELRRNVGKAHRVKVVEALRDAARGDFEPARAIFTGIADKERARWRPQRAKLAATLVHLGTCARLKDTDAAVEAFAHACELEPTNETALIMLAKLLFETGKPRDAEPILDRLISVAERASDPHALVFARILRGDCRATLGKLDAAVLDYQRAGEICRGQPQGDGPSHDWRRPLALAYASVGEVLLHQDKRAEALVQLKAAHAIQQQLVRDAPTSIDARRDLAGSCDRIADVHLANEEYEAALALFAQARTVAESLAKANPAHTELQRDFAVACSRMGEGLRALNRLPEALEAFRDDLAISSRIADASLPDGETSHDLAVSYANVGDMLCALGRPREALVSFDAAKDILAKLSEARPDDEDCAHELALLQARIGAAHVKLNAHDDALAAFAAVLVDAQKRAETKPHDVARQRALAQAHTRIGTLHLAATELDDAVASFDAARQIVEPISQGAREDVALQRECALCHGRIALARARADDREKALAAFQAGHMLLAGLNGGSEVLVADDKAWFEGQIAALDMGHAFTFQALPAVKEVHEPAE